MSQPATVHVYAPMPVERSATVRQCPTCERPKVMLGWFYEWHGWSVTCLGCGEMWEDGEMLPRPWVRAWREKSIAHARSRWRAGRDSDTMSKMDDPKHPDRIPREGATE